MKKFEYKIVKAEGHYPQFDENKLNELGKEGWELVGATKQQCIFKRETLN